MRTIIKILVLVVINLNVNCQTLPLLSPKDADNGMYYKDIDNVLPFWVGTWKGQVNNKEYTFEFVSFPHHLWSFPSGNYYYIDRLMGKFKVVDLANNQILYNDLNISEFEDYKIQFISHNAYNGYSFLYYDEIDNCFNFADFRLIKNSANLNQILFTDFMYNGYLHQDCTYSSQEDIPMFLPKVDLILTRQ